MKPHIVAIPYPAQGHAPPLFHLAKQFAAEGFAVTYVNIQSVHEQVKKDWTPPEGMDIRLDFIPCEWNIPQGFDLYCLKNMVAFSDMLTTLAPALELLIQRLPQCTVAIVTDYYMDFMQDVASKLGIMSVFMVPTCAGIVAFEHIVEDLVNKSLLPLKENVKEDVIHIQGLKPFRATDIPVYLQFPTPELIERLNNRKQNLKHASWILVNSCYHLEEDSFQVMKEILGQKFLSIGPLLDMDNRNMKLREEDPQCIVWLNTQRPRSVLYISFGSITVLCKQQFIELAKALELSTQPFLWVVRPGMVEGSPSELKGFWERTKKQGYMTAWANQFEVLAHESVGGFLTHCGWNSVLESITHGVPMLGWPLFCDQNWICKLIVQEWRVGVTLSGMGFVGEEEIVRGIGLLMEGEVREEMRRNAMELKQLVLNDKHNMTTLLEQLKQTNLTTCTRDVT